MQIMYSDVDEDIYDGGDACEDGEGDDDANGDDDKHDGGKSGEEDDADLGGDDDGDDDKDDTVAEDEVDDHDVEEEHMSKMSRFHTSHFMRKVTGRMPQTNWIPPAGPALCASLRSLRI